MRGQVRDGQDSSLLVLVPSRPRNFTLGFIVVVILQILSGKIPFLTKGPWALFFGGKEILHELSNAKPGRHLPYLYLISIIFNLVIFGIIPKG